jgi:hypothetical protein
MWALPGVGPAFRHRPRHSGIVIASPSASRMVGPHGGGWRRERLRPGHCRGGGAVGPTVDLLLRAPNPCIAAGRATEQGLIEFLKVHVTLGVRAAQHAGLTG